MDTILNLEIHSRNSRPTVSKSNDSRLPPNSFNKLNTLEKDKLCAHLCISQTIARGPNQNSFDATATLMFLVISGWIIETLIRTITGGDQQIQISWRSNSNRNDERQRLVRYDLRHPNEIFENGFVVRSYLELHRYNWNIFTYALGIFNPAETPFVSTALTRLRADNLWEGWMPSPGSYRMMDRDRLYVYEIFAPGGIDLNQSLGYASPFPEQNEVTFVGGIRREFIRSATEFTLIDGGTRYAVTRYFHNPALGLCRS